MASVFPRTGLVGTNWPHVPWPKHGIASEASLPPTLVDTKETREARSRYLAAVANADRDIGLIYHAAKKNLGDEVLFAFSSDHGSQFPFGKWNCYDAGVRTPLLVVWPGKVKAGSTSDAMVSWIDMLPTLLEACGGKPSDKVSGRSFLPVLLGAKKAHRQRVFLTHSGDGKMNEYPIRAVRTEKWKYIRNLNPAREHHTHVDMGNAGTDGRAYWDSWVTKARTDDTASTVVRRCIMRPAEELYDVIADPWELNNLAANPDHADTVQLLRSYLDVWMQANGDDGLTTELALPNPRAKK